MRASPVLTLLVLASACGFSEKEFQVKVIPEFCIMVADCTETVPVAACEDAMRTVDRSSCDYDPKSAKDCFKTLDDAICVDNGDVGTMSLSYPKVCDLAYDACGLLWDEPYPAVDVE